MVETAAKLTEQVLPQAPIRQSVVSFPIPLRLVFASRPELRYAVAGDGRSDWFREPVNNSV